MVDEIDVTLTVFLYGMVYSRVRSVCVNSTLFYVFPNLKKKLFEFVRMT